MNASLRLLLALVLPLGGVLALAGAPDAAPASKAAPLGSEVKQLQAVPAAMLLLTPGPQAPAPALKATRPHPPPWETCPRSTSGRRRSR